MPGSSKSRLPGAQAALGTPTSGSGSQTWSHIRVTWGSLCRFLGPHWAPLKGISGISKGAAAQEARLFVFRSLRGPNEPPGSGSVGRISSDKVNSGRSLLLKYFRHLGCLKLPFQGQTHFYSAPHSGINPHFKTGQTTSSRFNFNISKSSTPWLLNSVFSDKPRRHLS